MAANSLLNLVENIQSWDKLEKRIADLPTEMERGNAFEEFCHAFFFSILSFNLSLSIATRKVHTPLESVWAIRAFKTWA
jgi:hypothetical protein